jgi:hypothetical protein
VIDACACVGPLRDASSSSCALAPLCLPGLALTRASAQPVISAHPTGHRSHWPTTCSYCTGALYSDLLISCRHQWRGYAESNCTGKGEGGVFSTMLCLVHTPNASRPILIISSTLGKSLTVDPKSSPFFCMSARLWASPHTNLLPFE